MAKQAKTRQSGTSRRSGGTKQSGTRKKSGRNGRVSSADVIRRAKEQVEELTGRPIDGVLGLQRDDDGWIVTFELVELRRVPDSTDVLGSYAVAVDEKGDVREYRRTRRYYRSHVEEG